MCHRGIDQTRGDLIPEFNTLDGDAVSDVRFGRSPDERDVHELLEGGWILIDKPSGPSSHQLAAWARDMLGVEKLGHGGTLDPFATGSLTLLCGTAMRLTSHILKGDKTYIALFTIPDGTRDDALADALAALRGSIHNVPPKESAVKVQVRERRIDTFAIIERIDSDLLTEIVCEAGTYVRTIARDLGLLLGGDVQLSELRRSATGGFTEDDAVTMQQLADAVHLWKECDDDRAIRKVIQPMETLLASYPNITMKDGAVAAVSHGAPLARPGITGLTSGLQRGDEVVLTSLKGEVVAIGTMSVDGDKIPQMTSGEVARPHTVLMASDTYPKKW